jgi:hypothetical protein
VSTPAAEAAVRRPPAEIATLALVWRCAAVAGTAGAGLLHLVTAVQHASSGDLVVSFFLLVAGAQIGGATLLATRERFAPALLVAAVVGTAGLLLLYLLAHSSTLLNDLGVVTAGHDTGAHGALHGAGVAGHTEVAAGPVAMAGEAAASPEPVTTLGTATVAAEVLGMAGVLALLPARWRSRTLDVLALCGAGVWLLWFTGVLS